MRFTSLRLLATGVLLVLLLVLMAHVGVMGLPSSSGSCHALEGQTSCIVTDTLERSLVAPIASFLVVLAVMVIAARAVDASATLAPDALQRTRLLSLALIAPPQRALWCGTMQRRDDAHACAIAREAEQRWS